jgi:hypothetical protein
VWRRRTHLTTGGPALWRAPGRRLNTGADKQATDEHGITRMGSEADLTAFRGSMRGRNVVLVALESTGASHLVCMAARRIRHPT